MKETLAFRITALYRDFQACTGRELGTLGLRFGQMPFILYTGKHPGCTQAELTKALHLDWGYSQRSIAKLAEAGFMIKEYREARAYNCLYLTENGSRAFEVCHQVFQRWDQSKMQNFTPEEKETLLILLAKISI